MRKIVLASTAAVIAGAGLAQAGGLERSVLSVAPLFEEGRYLEFSGSFVSPKLDGVGGFVPAGTPFTISGSTGNLLESYAQFGFAYKADINDRLSYALILNQPYGASTLYPVATAGLPDATAVYNGSSADLTSYALTALLSYDVSDRFKIYGGPVFQSISPSASISFLSNYSVTAETDYGVGFTVGAAYSIPEIALRAALTYRSAIEHDLNTIESFFDTGSSTQVTVPTQTVFETPESLTFDFQSGVAENTLVFGQIHWVNWSEFNISPPTYLGVTTAAIGVPRPLVAYGDDWITYTLGVGRKFNDTWSGAVSVVYEPQTNVEMTSLGPVDGRIGLNVGATYTRDNWKISGGINYTKLGDARNLFNTDFDGGDAIGVGFRIGYTF